MKENAMRKKSLKKENLLKKSEVCSEALSQVAQAPSDS